MPVSSLSFRAYVATLSGRRLGAFKTAAARLGITLDDYIARVESGQKSCTDCRVWKDRGDFHPDATRWDGCSAKCKSCSSARGIAAYDTIPIEAVGRSGPPRAELRPGDKQQARHLINLDVSRGHRPNPNGLFCSKCGHKGDDRRHDYHHHMGYSAEHFYDVVPLCTVCHSEEHN